MQLCWFFTFSLHTYMQICYTRTYGISNKSMLVTTSTYRKLYNFHARTHNIFEPKLTVREGDSLMPEPPSAPPPLLSPKSLPDLLLSCWGGVTYWERDHYHHTWHENAHNTWYMLFGTGLAESANPVPNTFLHPSMQISQPPIMLVVPLELFRF